MPARTPARAGRLTVALVAVASVVLVGAVVITSPSLESGMRPRVALYGDSLGYEAAPTLREQLGDRVSLHNASVAGIALCDTLGRISSEVNGSQRPTHALIQFSGNNMSECMRHPDGRIIEGDELSVKYASDAHAAVELLRAAGVEVYLVGSPVSALGDGAHRVNAVFRQVAERWSHDPHVHYVAASEAVAPGDEYTRTMECLAFEGERHGCADGRIPVRAPDGNHFCPSGIEQGPFDCPVWSSGAYRFGRAMAAPLATDLGIAIDR